MREYIYCSVLVVFFVLVNNRVLSQTSPDSLKIYLRTHTATDTTYVRVLNACTWQLLQRSDFSRADSLLTKAEQTAIKINDDYGLQQTYYNRALGYYYQDHLRRSTLIGLS